MKHLEKFKPILEKIKSGEYPCNQHVYFNLERDKVYRCLGGWLVHELGITATSGIIIEAILQRELQEYSFYEKALLFDSCTTLKTQELIIDCLQKGRRIKKGPLNFSFEILSEENHYLEEGLILCYNKYTYDTLLNFFGEENSGKIRLCLAPQL